MNGWSSLEIVKVVIAALVPISVAVLGIIVAQLARRAQQREWVNQGDYSFLAFSDFSAPKLWWSA